MIGVLHEKELKLKLLNKKVFKKNQKMGQRKTINNFDLYQINNLPFTQIGGAPVAFAMRKDIAISSQFLMNQFQIKRNG